MKKIIYKIFVLIIFICPSILSKGWDQGDGIPHIYNPLAVTIQQVTLDGNNIKAFYYNTGVFDIDLRSSDRAGFEWPKGTGKLACFTAGLSMGCYINGQLREAMNSYKGELAPGYVTLVNGVPKAVTDGRFRVYRVKNPDNNSNPDYAQWGDMIPYGAPYEDIDHDNQYDPGIDKPGVTNASMTLFAVLTDGFPEEHKTGEGFGGGTQPMFAEYHFTAWAYTSPGLGDLQFIKWVVINKNIFPWEKLYMGVTVDPDLGWSDDDYIGCDTSRNMGFCYNGDNDDDIPGHSWAYGPSPPAFGMDYFTSAVNRNVTPPDTLGLTSFVYFTNNSTPGPSCEKDPNGEALPAYYMLKGLKKDQTPWVIPNTTPPQTTKYCYPGDPESGEGWTEGTPWGQLKGSVQNCNGSLTGTVVPINPVGDRRFIFNSGAENFTMQPGEEQTIILAQFVARGTNNFNSVTRLKRLDAVAQKIFDLNFNVIPPPPGANVNTSIEQINTGNVEITLSWDDIAETYNYPDTIFAEPEDTSFYRFEGYMVFEVNPGALTLPDLDKPETINNDIKLLAIFDKKNFVGFLVDTFSVGVDPHGGEQFAPFPVVPPYKSTTPPRFPNTGLQRRITITSTAYPEQHGGNTALIYGHTYKFAVLSYAYNTNPPALSKGLATIKNSLDSRVFSVKPEAPLAGSQFIFKNNDTLNTSRRDLGVMPIVMAQENVLEARYRILFNGPDTTYSILRSFNGGASFDQVKGNLKFSNYDAANNTVSDDSARVIDGILFKVVKIRFQVTGSGNTTNYLGNVGVIKDPVLSRDSIQTRNYGWDYVPAENNPYDSNKYRPVIDKPWQSHSMSISYPTRSTYIGIKSLINPEDLRKVKIVFTGYGNGQQAYRYLAENPPAYNFYRFKDMREVPLKVYEIDPYDGTTNERQLNCGFLEFPDGAQNNKWEPTADSLGGKEVLYIFGSDYSPNQLPQYSDPDKNYLSQQPTVDVMYVWAPRLKNQGLNFKLNDQFIIYPYTVTRPEVVPGASLYYDINTKAPTLGNEQVASQNNDLDLVRVVPNPYYGANSLENLVTGRFITFTRLPRECTIKIYTLNGDLIKVLQKNNASSTLEWNLTTLENVPVASGMYVALLNAPGIGYKVLKMAIFTPEERIDF